MLTRARRLVLMALFGMSTFSLAGCIERFFRTLKEQLLWVRSFKDAEAVRKAVAAWVAIYNENWLIERHGHRPPAAARREKLAIKLPA